jgi:hypothetical protein
MSVDIVGGVKATRSSPIEPRDIRRYAGRRVRMVVVDSDQLDVDKVLVGDLIGYVKRVDGKETGEAILIDVTGRGYAIALRRIKEVTTCGLLGPLWMLVKDVDAKDMAAEAARLTREGGHLKLLCGRCGEELEGGRAHRVPCPA